MKTDSLLPARAVWTRYGVTDRTLARWLEDAKLDFPRPVLINARRYWREADLVEWERSRVSAKVAA